jgi:hypothetical protein
MKTLISLTLLVISIHSVFACDICPMDEYSTIKNRGYVGVFYRYSLFRGYNYIPEQNNPFSFNQAGRPKKHNVFQDQNFYEDTPDDYESFQTLEFRLNYNHNDKWNFLLVLPYHYNINYFDKVTPPLGQTFDSTTVTAGFGDIIIGAQRLSTYETITWRHQFKYGLGLSLPTGNSELRANGNDAYNDPSHLPGKGATDLILRFNYTGSTNDKFGFKFNTLYAVSLKEAQSGNIIGIPSNQLEITDYRFGNRSSIDALLFYVIGTGNFKVIPKIGYSFNHAQKDKANAIELEGTGGVIGYGNIGADIVFGRFTWQTIFSKPVHLSLNGQQLSSTGRFQTGLLFSLKMNNK